MGIPAGTFVSSGTLRVQDLASAMLNVLEEYAPHRIEEIRNEYRSTLDWLSSGYSYSDEIPTQIEDDLDWLVTYTLPDALNEEAEPFVYFGASEGDGAHFRFWYDEDSVEEALDEHEKFEEIDDWDAWIDYRETVMDLVGENEPKALDLLRALGIPEEAADFE